jgi:hypothetical protein
MEDGKNEHGLRSRLYFNGKINDNWNYVGRIENQQWFHDNIGNEGTSFNIAKLEGRLGGMDVIAGRDDDVFADGYIYDGEHDAIKLSYGNKWYISGAYGKLTDLNEDTDNHDFSKHFWTAEIGSKFDGGVNGKVGYFNTKLGQEGKEAYNGNDSLGIWYAGVNFDFKNDIALNAMYLRGNRDKIGDGDSVSKNGYVVGLSYKGADFAEPGSWGLAANYYHQGRSTYLAHTIDGFTEYASGFKGWSVGGNVALAKNMILGVTYYDTKGLKSAVEEKNENEKEAHVLWTQLDIAF